MFAGVLLL
jgi:hypothetical protein